MWWGLKHCPHGDHVPQLPQVNILNNIMFPFFFHCISCKKHVTEHVSILTISYTCNTPGNFWGVFSLVMSQEKIIMLLRSHGHNAFHDRIFIISITFLTLRGREDDVTPFLDHAVHLTSLFSFLGFLLQTSLDLRTQLENQYNSIIQTTIERRCFELSALS